MSQSIRIGYILPRTTPGKILLSKRMNPATEAIFFNSLAWAKNDGGIPGGGLKLSQTQRNCSFSLQKIL